MKRIRNDRNHAAAKYTCFVLLFFSFITISQSINAQANKWIAPKEADDLKNPLADKTDVLPNAKVMYTTYCAPCHGNKGKGDGPAAAGLTKKPADHSSAYVQTQTDGAIFWMISEGHTPMPSYKVAFTETQRWALVNYIRTLAKTPKK